MKDFKENLVKFFKEEFGASDEFCRKIEDCDNFEEIRCFFEESDEFKELFDLDDLESDVSDLKKEVEDLEDQVEDLEEEIKCLESEVSELEYKFKNKGFNPTTLWEEEKFVLFMKYQDKFTPTEFENLLTKS